MGKSLDLIKKLVSESVKEGASAEQVKRIAEFEKAIAGAEEEEKELIKTNGELTKAYKDLIHSTAGTVKDDPVKKDFETPKCPSFDEALMNFSKGLDIEGKEKRK